LIKLNTRGDIINSQHDAYVLFLPHELSGQISDKSGFEHYVVYEHRRHRTRQTRQSRKQQLWPRRR
jgi:hypothetical protein